MLQSSSSEKYFILKPLKIAILGSNLDKKGSGWACPKWKTLIYFFFRNNKSRSLAFKKILLYQNIVCFEWVRNLFLFCEMLFWQKKSFPVKAAVIYLLILWNLLTVKVLKNLKELVDSCSRAYIKAGFSGFSGFSKEL